ncbi:MAG: ABC transporter permease [Acetobacteraceae bacterium]|nr:ABC transporter permease [Acetobacteraceae bacterium]
MSRALRELGRSRAGSFGAFIIVLFVGMALVGPWIVTRDPLRPSLRDRFAPPTYAVPPTSAYALGGDQLGRDELSRLVAGSRVTLLVAVAAVVLGSAVGISLGLIAGYFGGWPDRIVMRLADIQLSIPLMLFALIVIAALGPSLVTLVSVLALTGWTRYARIIRAEVLSLREREFVLLAVSAGAGPWRIIVRHILPNVSTAAIVVATLELARVVILESSLSFLGLGVQPPMASWGRMLAEGRSYVSTAWWLTAFPGIAIILVVLGINLLGDWMRDYFDPRLARL